MPSFFSDCNVGRHHALEGWLTDQEFDGHDFALAVGQFAVLHGPARFLKEADGLAQVRAVVPAAIRFGNVVLFGEDFRRQTFFMLLEDGEFAPFRQAARGEFRIGKIAIGTLILAVEQVLVQPFEIERPVEGFAHTRVLKLPAPGY